MSDDTNLDNERKRRRARKEAKAVAEPPVEAPKGSVEDILKGLFGSSISPEQAKYDEALRDQMDQGGLAIPHRC